MIWFDIYQFNSLVGWMCRQAEITGNDQWHFFDFAMYKLGYASFQWNSDSWSKNAALSEDDYVEFLLRWS